MKHLKILGLTAIAASALMAFAGTGTASASVVCSTTVSPCPQAQRWPNSAVDFSSENSAGTGAGKVVFEDPFGFVTNECESTIQGTLTNGSSTATTTLSGITWTWSNCIRVAKTINTGTLEIHNIAGTSNGTVTASGFTVTIVEPEIFGGGEVSCVYESGTGLDLGTLTEGNPATMDVSTTLTLDVGQPAECSSTKKWTAKYKATSPSGTTGSLSTS